MRARELFESRIAPLYHGTGIASLLNILATNSLNTSQDYDDDPLAVSLTRDPRVAAGFMSRNAGTDLGAILVLDQQKLVHTFRIAPFAAVDIDGNSISNEEEEVVYSNIKPLDRYLLSINIADRVFKTLDDPFHFNQWWEQAGRDFGQTDDIEECRARLAALRVHPLLNRLVPRGSPKPRPHQPFTPDEMKGIKAIGAAEDVGVFYPTNYIGIMDDREMSKIIQRLKHREIVSVELVGPGDRSWEQLHVTKGPNWYLTQ